MAQGRAVKLAGHTLMPEMAGSRDYDFTSTASVPAGAVLLSSGGNGSAGGGAVPVSWPAPVVVPLEPFAAGETMYPSFPMSGEDATSLFETLFPVDDELHIVWQDSGPKSTGEIIEVTMPDGLPGYSFVDGDFYDIQISLDYGLFDDLPVADFPQTVSFGSTLDSGASDYEAIVIGGDLIEINLVMQFNALLETDLDGMPTVPGADDIHVQSNAALIAEYAVDQSVQYTAGSEVNIATIEQGNLAVDVAGAVQINEAAIFQLTSDVADVDEAELPPMPDLPDLPENDPAGIAASIEDLFPELAHDPDAGVLSVKGSFVEVNVIVQASGAAAKCGDEKQSNDAVLKDFDGVAAHQYVGGNVVDVNSIAQVNQIAKSGHAVPDWLAEAFPGKGLEKASGLVGEMLDKHAKGSFEHFGKHHHGHGKGHDNHDDDHHHHGHLAKAFGDPMSDWSN